MNLEIQKPELVRRVTAHIQTGHFHDVDDVIEKALDALDVNPPCVCRNRCAAAEKFCGTLRADAMVAAM